MRKRLGRRDPFIAADNGSGFFSRVPTSRRLREHCVSQLARWLGSPKQLIAVKPLEQGQGLSFGLALAFLASESFLADVELLGAVAQSGDF